MGNLGLAAVIIITFSLTSCSPGRSTSGRINCSSGGEVCITASAVEPIHHGAPVMVTIKVTSSKDISDLHVILQAPIGVTTDGPQNWEPNLFDTTNQPTNVSWGFAIKAGQTLTFTRVLHLPPSDGYLHVVIMAATQDFLISDAFYILQTNDSIKIAGAGTPIPPFTPNFTAPAYGPGTPVPTFLLPTDTPPPSHVTSPTSIQIVPLVATSTHTPYPGPTSYP